MKKLSVILLSLMLCLPLCAQFKGTVYIDSNQSGILDKSDKPLMDVLRFRQNLLFLCICLHIP